MKPVDGEKLKGKVFHLRNNNIPKKEINEEMKGANAIKKIEKKEKKQRDKEEKRKRSK